MPHKKTKPPVQVGANKAASASRRRSIVVRASKAVAKTRKAIGKVAGRTEREVVTKPVASRPATLARTTSPAARARIGQAPAARARGAKKASASPKKAVAKKAARSRSAGRAVVASGAAVAKRVSAGKKVAVTKGATAAKKAPAARKVTVAKRVTAAKEITATKKVSAGKKAVGSAKVRPQVEGARRTAKATASSPARTARRAPAKPGAKAGSPRPGSTRPSPARPTPVRAPRTGYTEERFLGHQRNVLERERATYLEQASSLQAEAELLVAEMEPGDIQFDEESGEGGTVAVDRERDLTLSAQALEAVAEIDAALARIASGRYGVCEGCGELIPKLRLEALPYARLCMACKSGGLSRR